MIKMAQLEDIRKMYFMEDLSIREISRRTGIHRDTISKYLATDEPMPPKYQLTQERNIRGYILKRDDLNYLDRPVDIVLYTPQQFERISKKARTMASVIAKEGVVLHG